VKSEPNKRSQGGRVVKYPGARRTLIWSLCRVSGHLLHYKADGTRQPQGKPEWKVSTGSGDGTGTDLGSLWRYFGGVYSVGRYCVGLLPLEDTVAQKASDQGR
jgi:hypothetical protein